jgi:NADPH:quinone reductase
MSAAGAKTMRALRFAEFGPPSVLRIEEVAIPEPRYGEALIRVKAAAINPSDVGNVAGRFKRTTLPRTPGRDFAGVVVQGKQHEGEEVWGSCSALGVNQDGSHAEYLVVPTETLTVKPKALSFAQASAIGVPFMTAWASVVSAAQIREGETLLIVGAGGAVGQAATQIAALKKVRVIGADTSSGALPGVEAVINTRTEDLRTRVHELTGGKGADVVLDTVGSLMFEPALQSLRNGGRQVVISSAGEPRVSFNLVEFYHHSLKLMGVDSYGLAPRDVAEIATGLRPGFESGILRPAEVESVAFEKAVEAYERVAGRETKRKLVLSFE